MRDAEALAGTAGCVSGPADAAPEALSTQWVQDWIERAKRTLEQALEQTKRDADESKEKARQIAEAIKSGAERLQPLVNPGFAAGKYAGDQAKQAATGMYEAAKEGAQSETRSKMSSALDRIIAIAKKILVFTGIGIGALILVWLGASVLTGWVVSKGGSEVLKGYAHAKG